MTKTESAILADVRAHALVDVTTVATMLCNADMTHMKQARRDAAAILQSLTARGALVQVGQWDSPARPEQGGPAFVLPTDALAA